MHFTTVNPIISFIICTILMILTIYLRIKFFKTKERLYYITMVISLLVALNGIFFSGLSMATHTTTLSTKSYNADSVKLVEVKNPNAKSYRFSLVDTNGDVIVSTDEIKNKVKNPKKYIVETKKLTYNIFASNPYSELSEE